MKNTLYFIIFACSAFIITKMMSTTSTAHKTKTKTEYQDMTGHNKSPMNDVQSNSQAQSNTAKKRSIEEIGKIESDYLSDEEVQTVFRSNQNQDPSERVKQLNKISSKLTNCIQKNFCNEKPTIRKGSIEYFDPDASAHHGLLRTALNEIQNHIDENPSLASSIDIDTLIKSTSIQNNNIPLIATLILTQHFAQKVSPTTIIKQLARIKGPVKAQSLSVISHTVGATPELKKSIENELKEDTDSSWDTFNEVSNMNLNNQEYLEVLQAACALKHPRVRPKKAQRRFNKIIQRDLSRRHINMAPNDICS